MSCRRALDIGTRRRADSHEAERDFCVIAPAMVPVLKESPRWTENNALKAAAAAPAIVQRQGLRDWTDRSDIESPRDERPYRNATALPTRRADKTQSCSV